MKGKKSRASGVGFVAALLTTGAYIPQVVSVWMRMPKPADDISLVMYGMMSLGVAGWLLYGCLIRAWPVAVSNVITLSLTISVLIYKFVYG